MIKQFFYTIVRWGLNIIFLGRYRLHVEGREHIPSEGAVIIAPNHKSYFDPPLVGVAIKKRVVHYMAKEELFRNPFFRWILRQFGTFPVKRGSVDRTAVRQAVKELKNGNALGIFPEGTRIKRSGLGRFHSGMASLALMTGTPVIPVAIVGSADMPHKKGPLAVLIGMPIKVQKQKAGSEEVEALNEAVKKEIQKLTDEYEAKIENKR